MSFSSADLAEMHVWNVLINKKEIESKKKLVFPINGLINKKFQVFVKSVLKNVVSNFRLRPLIS